MLRIITCTNKKAKNAGPKAKEDVNSILNEQYKNNIKCKTFYEIENVNIIKKTINLLKKVLFIITNTWFNFDTIIIQYPLSNQLGLIKLFPKKRTIILIHDLQGLRMLDDNKEKMEINAIKKFSNIIVHNNSMKKYFLDNEFKEETLHVLGMFDYLSYSNNNININQDASDDNVLSVAFVGNLIKEKSPFIYQLDDSKMNFHINLYGVGISNDINTKLKYKGSFEAYDLPNVINEKLGLVWDGNYDESDESVNYKNYLKYNNPHKLSCYIAAGIPVIVWSKSATAEFVKKHEIGYVIDNIYDINNIDISDYNVKKKNVNKLKSLVRDGYYTKRVFDEILSEENYDEDK